MLLLVLSSDADIRGGHAILPDFFGGKLPARHWQSAQIGAKVLEIAARIDERAKGHVSADARKTVKIGEFHGNRRRAVGPPLERIAPPGCKLIVSALRRGVKLTRVITRDF